MHDPTPDDIDALIEQIDAEQPWAVDDWHLESGMYDTPTLTVDLEWRPISSIGRDDLNNRRRFIKETLTESESGDGLGMAEDDLADAYLDAFDATGDEFEQIIDDLKRRGEVYEPATGRLRVV